jgi:hypothetical protein
MGESSKGLKKTRQASTYNVALRHVRATTAELAKTIGKCFESVFVILP